jgi:outer membrane immunogenic protein
MLRCVALGAAALAVVASWGSANASDFSVPAPAPVAGSDWDGLYFGGHVGYGMGDWVFDGSHSSGAIHYNDPFDPATGKLSGANGVLGGLQAGANKQFGSGLLGIEADVSWTGLTGSGTFFTTTAVGHPYAGYPYGTQWDVTTKLDLFGTVRGRAGIVNGPVLLYATGGLAWGIVNANQMTTHPDPLPTGTPGGVTSGKVNHIGYAVGGGLEWMMAPNWTLKAEYIFADLGQTNYMLNGTVSPTDTTPYTETFATALKLQTVRVGINYLFK